VIAMCPWCTQRPFVGDVEIGCEKTEDAKPFNASKGASRVTCASGRKTRQAQLS
jgi:hypothetical protein